MRNPPSRPDYLVYGRYIDPVAVILAAIGTASLLTKVIRGTPKVLLTALTGSALLGVAVRYFRDGFDTSPFAVNEGVIAGVASWPFDRAGLDVVRWTAVAVAAGALILLSTLYHRRATAATVMVLLVLGCASGTRRAVVEHAMWDNSVLFEHYPPAPEGYETVAVAANARGGTAYNFNAPTQHYALAPLGWNFQTIDGDGDWLASHPPDDAGMLVMLSASGPPKGGWCHMPPYANVIIWARLDVVLPGIDDGPCTLSG